MAHSIHTILTITSLACTTISRSFAHTIPYGEVSTSDPCPTTTSTSIQTTIPPTAVAVLFSELYPEIFNKNPTHGLLHGPQTSPATELVDDSLNMPTFVPYSSAWQTDPSGESESLTSTIRVRRTHLVIVLVSILAVTIVLVVVLVILRRRQRQSIPDIHFDEVASVSSYDPKQQFRTTEAKPGMLEPGQWKSGPRAVGVGDMITQPDSYRKAPRSLLLCRSLKRKGPEEGERSTPPVSPMPRDIIRKMCSTRNLVQNHASSSALTLPSPCLLPPSSVQCWPTFQGSCRYTGQRSNIVGNSNLKRPCSPNEWDFKCRGRSALTTPLPQRGVANEIKLNLQPQVKTVRRFPIDKYKVDSFTTKWVNNLGFRSIEPGMQVNKPKLPPGLVASTCIPIQDSPRTSFASSCSGFVSFGVSGVYNSYRIPGRLWRGSDASTSTESGSDVSTIPENHFSFGIGNEGNAVKGDEPDCSLKIPVSPAIDEKSKMKLGKLDTSTITTITTHISDTNQFRVMSNTLTTSSSMESVAGDKEIECASECPSRSSLRELRPVRCADVPASDSGPVSFTCSQRQKRSNSTQATFMFDVHGDSVTAAIIGLYEGGNSTAISTRVSTASSLSLGMPFRKIWATGYGSGNSRSILTVLDSLQSVAPPLHSSHRKEQTPHGDERPSTAYIETIDDGDVPIVDHGRVCSVVSPSRSLGITRSSAHEPNRSVPNHRQMVPKKGSLKRPEARMQVVHGIADRAPVLLGMDGKVRVDSQKTQMRIGHSTDARDNNGADIVWRTGSETTQEMGIVLNTQDLPRSHKPNSGLPFVELLRSSQLANFRFSRSVLGTFASTVYPNKTPSQHLATLPGIVSAGFDGSAATSRRNALDWNAGSRLTQSEEGSPQAIVNRASPQTTQAAAGGEDTVHYSVFFMA